MTSSGSFARGSAAPSVMRSPFVLGLALWFGRERIGFLDQLMIPRAEIGFSRLEDVELGFLFEVGDQFLGVGRLRLVHGLRHHLERELFDPGMALRRLSVLLVKRVDNALRG